MTSSHVNRSTASRGSRTVVAAAVAVERLRFRMELVAVRLQHDPKALVREVHPREEPVVDGSASGGSTTSPAGTPRARSDDSNGPVARASEAASTRATRSRCRNGSHALRASTADGRRPARRAESATDRASANGRSRQQSMTVRTGVVTHPSVTSSASRSRQCRTTPSDAPLGRLRLARTVTWAGGREPHLPAPVQRGGGVRGRAAEPVSSSLGGIRAGEAVVAV